MPSQMLCTQTNKAELRDCQKCPGTCQDTDILLPCFADPSLETVHRLGFFCLHCTYDGMFWSTFIHIGVKSCTMPLSRGVGIDLL